MDNDIIMKNNKLTVYESNGDLTVKVTGEGTDEGIFNVELQKCGGGTCTTVKFGNLFKTGQGTLIWYGLEGGSYRLKFTNPDAGTSVSGYGYVRTWEP
jgi:hypothetical protein